MKIAKRIITLLTAGLITFFFIDAWQQSVAEKADGFTEGNLWAYYFYTDPQIRHAPELSKNRRFMFQSQDGSRPEMSSVVYQGSTEVVLLRAYLTGLGYQRSTDREEERWQKYNAPLPAFLIVIDDKNERVILSKVVVN